MNTITSTVNQQKAAILTNQQIDITQKSNTAVFITRMHVTGLHNCDSDRTQCKTGLLYTAI